MNTKIKLTDMKLKDFLDVLSSKEPTPGGGSVSALAGLMAASLGLMVVKLTVGKKAFLALDEDEQKKFMSGEIILKESYNRLARLADDDADAFNSYMTAIRMPKNTDTEQETRNVALTQAAKYMTQVPLDTCRECLYVLQGCNMIAGKCNKNAASDVRVAILLAYAGLKGAAANVLINLPAVDEAAREYLTGEAKKLTADGEILHDKALELLA